MVIKTLFRLSLFWLFTVYSTQLFAVPDQVSLQAIEDNVEQVLKTFDVPGAAVAIVKDGQVVMAKGFGVRNNKRKARVDENTLFGIASNTKAFTAAALAMLVDEGKLSWDDKVVNLVPGFKLADPYATAELTVRDILSHRSGLGLGAGDLMIWPPSKTTKAQLLNGLQHLKPASSIRSRYAYNNLMYVIAGEVVANVSGMSWEAFIRTRILKPLGMMDTRMNFARIGKANNNVATPHAPVNGKVVPVGGDFLQDFSSAGSMVSNVNDMSRWLRLQLRGGVLSTEKEGESRLFSAKAQQQMWHPHIMRMVSQFDKEHYNSHFRGYGLGWGLNDHFGYKVVSHTGGIMGMVSRVVLVPELQLGVVVLTNQQSGSAFMAITNDILTRYMGKPEKDWVSIYHESVLKGQARGKAHIEDLMNSRDADSKPTLPLSAYAQTYHDAWYGDITISEKDGKLYMAFSKTPELQGYLEHYQYDTFIVRWKVRSFDADAFITFSLNEKGEIAQAVMKAVSGATDFSFDFHDLVLKPTKNH